MLKFPSVEALREALHAGVIPANIMHAPIEAVTGQGVTLRWQPGTVELSRALGQYGASRAPSTQQDWQTFPCWAALIPLIPCAQADSQGATLIRAPLPRIAEIATRARDTSAWLIHETTGWLRLHRLSSALRYQLLGDTEVTLYQQAQPNLWIEVGFQHRDPTLLPTSNTTLFAVSRQGWQTLPQAGWRSVHECVNCPPWATAIRSNSGKLRVPVPLRLTTLPTSDLDPPSMWIFSGEPEQFISMMAEIDQRLLAGYHILQRPERKQILLLAPGEPGALEFPRSLQSYSRHPDLSGLFLPRGQVLAPRLNPRNLSEYLQLSDQELVCIPSLSPYRLHRFRLADFQRYDTICTAICRRTPLAVSHHDLTTDLFHPMKCVIEDHDPSRTPQSYNRVGTRNPANPGRKPSLFTKLKESLFGKKPKPVPKAEIPTEAAEASEPTPAQRPLPTDREDIRSILEAAVLREPVTQVKPWHDLARFYQEIGQHADAALCWLNTIWHAPSPTPEEWIEALIQAEARSAQIAPEQCLPAHILKRTHHSGLVRLAAALMLRSEHHAMSPQEMTRLCQWWESQEESLPLRLNWLAQEAVSRRSHRDVLRLARAHDRLLDRLNHEGLGLDRDAPSALRFHGRVSGERVQHLRQWLIRIREPIHAWIRKHGQQKTKLTGKINIPGTLGMTDLLLCTGLSKLGDRQIVHDWAAHAEKLLGQATQQFEVDYTQILSLFRSRIGLQSRSLRRVGAATQRPESPGSPDAATVRPGRGKDRKQAHLPTYACEKLRCHLTMLDAGKPGTNPYGPTSISWLIGKDDLAEHLRNLIHPQTPTSLGKQLAQVLEICQRHPNARTIPRVVALVLSQEGLVDRETAVRVLKLVPSAILLLPECLRVVFGETQSSTLIRVVCLFLRESARWAVAHECVVELEQIAEAITKSAEPESVVWAALQRQNAGKEFLQALLKLKLAASHDQLARRILKNLPPSKPFALLPFAGAGIKRLEGNELMTVLNEARNKLFLVNRAQDRSHPEHAEQYVRALAAVDPAITLGRIEELFQRLDPFPNPETLQDYYCFPALVLVDRVLSTVITEDFEISDLAQAWLEQDEEQIRRRIRQDCARFLAESP